jgi:Heparinase II/III-like protein
VRGHRAVAVFSVGAALALVALWLVFASSSRAASPAEIAELKLQPCPTYEVGRTRTYSDTEVEVAKQGHFEVMNGLSAHLDPPVDWGQDPYSDRSWVHYLHGFYWLDQLLYAYVAEGDVAALADARDLLLDWVAQVRPGDPAYPDEAWGDKTTGDRAAFLGYVTRAAACSGVLTDAQASALIDAGREHGAHLADADHYVASNHGLYVDIGLSRLALHLEFLPEAEAWSSLAQSRFPSTVNGRLIPGEGLWLEHSTGYQFVVMRLMTAFARVVGEEQLFADELAAMRDVAGWLTLPSERLVPWGDSRETPSVAWAVAEGADDHGLRVLRRSGLAVVKHAGGYLIVNAAFHNTTHKHPDDLGFHLYDSGRDVISDSGFPDYNNNKWRQFSRSVRAHSVLTISGWEFPVGNPKLAYGSGIVATGKGDGWYAIEGRNPLLRERGVRHRRLFLYRPGRTLLVLDTVRSRRRHTYVRRFQIAAGLKARGSARGIMLKGEGFRGALRNEGARAHRRAVKGHYSPPLGWSFPDVKRRVPRWAIELRSKAEDARYLEAIGLRGAARAKLLGRSRRVVRVRVGGRALAAGTVSVRRRGDRLLVQRRRAHRRG